MLRLLMKKGDFYETHVASSSVASTYVWGAKMFDFRRKTLFCLGYRLSKHKMTTYSLSPPGHPYAIGWLWFTLLAVQTYNLNSKLPTQTHQLHHLASRTAFSNTITSHRKTAVLLKPSNVTFAEFFTSIKIYADKPTQRPGQPGPTSFDPRDILQKRDHFRITSNKMI